MFKGKPQTQRTRRLTILKSRKNGTRKRKNKNLGNGGERGNGTDTTQGHTVIIGYKKGKWQFSAEIAVTEGRPDFTVLVKGKRISTIT